MSEGFIGRKSERILLDDHLAAVRAGVGRGVGRLLVVRGRRQVGKSRLLSEFVATSGVPQLYFTGSRQTTVADDIARFRSEVDRSSTLPGRDLVAAGNPSNWDSALRLLAAALPVDGPAIVVLDEFPWLLERDQGLDGTLQVIWDTVLEHRNILLVLVGSDLAIMQRLTAHDRPLFGRAKEMIVRPFHPRDSARVLGLKDRAADAIDAQLVTGGYPRLLLESARHESLDSFVDAQLADENSDLCVNAERVLAAEFPQELSASLILRAIGSGERSFRNIAQATQMSDTTLARSLIQLVAKGVVAKDQPVSVPSRQH